MATSTLTPTTELEAVNIIIGTIGEAPVNSLTDPGVGDAGLARSVLAEVSRAVQEKGWHFNTEIEYPLVPDVDGIIEVPANCAKVDLDDTQGDILDITLRGTRLYDRRNHTFSFERTVYVTMVVLLGFTDLPEAARRYITIKAARIFQQRNLGSETLDAFTSKDEQEAMVAMKAAENQNADHNILNGRNGRRYFGYRPYAALLRR